MKTYEKLTQLHDKLTDVYIEILEAASSDGESTEDADADEDDLGLGILMLSPAMLTSAANFLKQNDITAQPEEGDSMSELAKKLREKQQQGRAKLRAVSED